MLAHDDSGLVALAEVRRERILDWVPAARRASFRAIAEETGAQGDFDLDVLYDARRLRAVDHVWVESFHAGGRVRAGLVVRFQTACSDPPGSLIVAVAHWRSDMGDSRDAAERRMRAAEGLRVQIGKMRDSAPVLVMGDLNAEPFEGPLEAGLPASRFRDAVRLHRPRGPEDVLLYNPSWRWLGEREPWTSSTRPFTLAGTYKKAGNHPSAWRTFDQVLVSGELLGPSGWSLREDTLGVGLDDDVFDAERSRPRLPFDHLPLVGLLEWVAPAS